MAFLDPTTLLFKKFTLKKTLCVNCLLKCEEINHNRPCGMKMTLLNEKLTVIMHYASR